MCLNACYLLYNCILQQILFQYPYLHEFDHQFLKPHTKNPGLPTEVQNRGKFPHIQRCRYWYQRGYCPFHQSVTLPQSSAPSLITNQNSAISMRSISTTKLKFATTSNHTGIASTAKGANFYTLTKPPLSTLDLKPLCLLAAPLSAKNTQTFPIKILKKNIKKDWKCFRTLAVNCQICKGCNMQETRKSMGTTTSVSLVRY